MAFLQEHECLDLGDTLVHYNFILTCIITSAKTPLPNEVTFTDRRVRVCTCLVGGQNPAIAVCKWFLCPAWEAAHSTSAHTPLAETQPREPQLAAQKAGDGGQFPVPGAGGTGSGSC